MRPIKFRAWLPNEGIISFEEIVKRDWTIGSLFYATGIKYMQFTGLTDKNGKEIYEGDKINTQFGKGEIVYKDGCFRFVPYGKTAQVMDSDCLRNFDIKDDELEVI